MKNGGRLRFSAKDPVNQLNSAFLDGGVLHRTHAVYSFANHSLWVRDANSSGTHLQGVGLRHDEIAQRDEISPLHCRIERRQSCGGHEVHPRLVQQGRACRALHARQQARLAPLQLRPSPIRLPLRINSAGDGCVNTPSRQ
jgi:hypothetical protein